MAQWDPRHQDNEEFRLPYDVYPDYNIRQQRRNDPCLGPSSELARSHASSSSAPIHPTRPYVNTTKYHPLIHPLLCDVSTRFERFGREIRRGGGEVLQGPSVSFGYGGNRGPPVGGGGLHSAMFDFDHGGHVPHGVGYDGGGLHNTIFDFDHGGHVPNEIGYGGGGGGLHNASFDFDHGGHVPHEMGYGGGGGGLHSARFDFDHGGAGPHGIGYGGGGLHSARFDFDQGGHGPHGIGYGGGSFPHPAFPPQAGGSYDSAGFFPTPPQSEIAAHGHGGGFFSPPGLNFPVREREPTRSSVAPPRLNFSAREAPVASQRMNFPVREIGTGVFIPRISAADAVRRTVLNRELQQLKQQQQRQRQRQRERQRQKKHMMKTSQRSELERNELVGFDLPNEIGLPQDWTYSP